jgi:hypothetical protein
MSAKPLSLHAIRERITNAKGWLFDPGDNPPYFDLARTELQPLKHNDRVMARIDQFAKYELDDPDHEREVDGCLIVAGLEQAIDELGRANGLRKRVPNPSGEFEPDYDLANDKILSRDQGEFNKVRKAMRQYISHFGYREYLVLAHYMSEDQTTGHDSYLSSLLTDDPGLIDCIIDQLESLFVNPDIRDDSVMVKRRLKK